MISEGGTEGAERGVAVGDDVQATTEGALPSVTARSGAAAASAPAQGAARGGPLSGVEPWDLVADGYDAVTRSFLGEYSAYALDRVGLRPHWRMLDVAAGPGTATLLAAGRVREVTAVDFSPAMLERLRVNSTAAGLDNVRALQADGQALPFADRSFELGVSMFGLMFFPDRARGFGELWRVLAPGGLALVSSWAPLDRSPAMDVLFGALRAIDPSLPAPQRDIASLENPERFAQELSAAGFVDVTIEALERFVPVLSPEDFWDTMTRGSAPLVLNRHRVGEAEWARRSHLALAFLRSELQGVQRLGSTAYLGKGRKADQ